ncbi:MAG TPA: beta-ketoacyl-ACP synthase III [Bacteriovoracaceae bacterium]|nr:beta-ketoacyl-ACP synthase III [Bacteriovoracaceae bacterium]
MFKAEIIGTGMYVPENIITNYDLEKMMDTSHDWIVQRSGIEERRWVNAEEGTSDLALKASLKAIENAGIDKNEIDCILFATLSPDYYFPGSGCILQAKLGVQEIPAIDVRQQCSGFLYGMSMADSFIKTGMYKTILLVGAEVHSKGLNKTTAGRDVSVLFGDGAGAVVIRAKETDDPKASGILSTHLYSDGNGASDLWTQAPGMAIGPEMINHEMIEKGLHYPQMNGKKVFVNAVRRMCEAMMTAFDHNKVKLDDVDLFLFHQANLRINQKIAEELKIPEEKIFNTIQKYGNTTAATLPIGMDEAVRAGKLKKGMLVASAVFGSDYTWGAGLYRW